MQDKITIADAPECLNANDKAMWVLGYEAAIEARGQCLHQIQEPAAAEQAAWHAGLDEDRAQAAPAAVAVPDAAEIIRNLVDHIELNTCEHHETYRGGSIWEVCSDCGAKWADDRGGKPSFKWPDAVERAREFLLAATPAADAPAWDGKLPEQLQRCLNTLRMECKSDAVNDLEFEVRSVFSGMHTSLTTVKRMYHAAQKRLDSVDAAQPDPFADPAAAAPVVLPEPRWHNPSPHDAAHFPYYTPDDVRALLAQQLAIMPKGESAAAQLRAMATNYPAGHSWDKLDAKACIRGALEIEALRAQLATAPTLRGIQVTEEMHAAAVKVLHRANGIDGLPQRMLDAMLAVAPALADAPAVPKWIDDPHDIAAAAQEVLPDDAEIIAALEAAGVKFLKFMGGLDGKTLVHTTSGSQKASSVIAGCRALLATATGLPAQAMEPTDEQLFKLWQSLPAQGDPTGQRFAIVFARAVLGLQAAHSAPQAQADAREAQLLAFAVSEIRRDEMTDSELLDAMEQERIAVVPEYEGPWDAEVYNDEGEPIHAGSGSTPREAIRAAIAAAKGE